jgi:uncharacterized metal-binding protein YceD (DUF177 family)
MSKSRKPVLVDPHPAQSLRAPMSRVLRVDEIKQGEELSFEASAAERTEIAKLLDLTALDRLSLVCSFERGGEGRLLVRGTLSAAVTQTCVVSLEPVASAIAAPVEVEFWPAQRVDELARSAEETASHGLLEWPEPIDEGKIDLGPVIYETLSTSLDPYPRAEGVSFEWQEEDTVPSAEAKPESPFATLASLKRG